MKRTITFLLLLTLAVSVSAQGFYSSQRLKPKQFTLGIEPAVLVNGNANFMLFLHGGVGIAKGVDLGLTFGTLSSTNYFGANLSFGMGQYLSATFGAHSFGVFGLDATLAANFPLRKDIRLFSGVDTDINFYDDKPHLQLWLPLGVEIGLRSNMSFVFETNIGLVKQSYHLIGAGVNFYF